MIKFLMDELGWEAWELLLTVAILFVIFLAIREFWCWYWKINERLRGQTELIEEVRNLRTELLEVRIADTDADLSPGIGED